MRRKTLNLALGQWDKPKAALGCTKMKRLDQIHTEFKIMTTMSYCEYSPKNISWSHKNLTTPVQSTWTADHHPGSWNKHWNQELDKRSYNLPGGKIDQNTWNLIWRRCTPEKLQNKIREHNHNPVLNVLNPTEKNLPRQIFTLST